MDKNLKFKRNIYTFLFIIFLFLIILSLIYIIFYSYNTYKIMKESDLLDEISIDENVIEQKDSEDVDIQEKTERMLKLEELQKGNSDIIGWIEIENTNIDYPVLQGEDNDFYMNHNSKKQYSSGGSIFLDKDYDWSIPSSNLLMYGHNLKSGAMFQNLLKYKDQKFYEQHPTIRFTTNKEDAIYEIIAVFPSRIYYKSENNVFRYYYFINANNENEYNEFVENAKKSSLYDTGKTAEYGEQLMTLSTCAYHTDDGRFVVVARKMSMNVNMNGEN